MTDTPRLRIVRPGNTEAAPARSDQPHTKEVPLGMVAETIINDVGPEAAAALAWELVARVSENLAGSKIAAHEVEDGIAVAAHLRDVGNQFFQTLIESLRQQPSNRCGEAPARACRGEDPSDHESDRTDP